MWGSGKQYVHPAISSFGSRAPQKTCGAISRPNLSAWSYMAQVVFPISPSKWGHRSCLAFGTFLNSHGTYKQHLPHRLHILLIVFEPLIFLVFAGLQLRDIPAPISLGAVTTRDPSRPIFQDIQYLRELCI